MAHVRAALMNTLQLYQEADKRRQIIVLRNGEEVIFGSQILDSGATTHLSRTVLNGYLQQAKSSKIQVSTAVDGKPIEGDLFGTLKMYVLNIDSERPGCGQMIDHETDTLPGLTEDLFSMSNYYELGCDIILKHEGFSGIRGVDPRTGKQIEIPARYDYDKRSWMIDFVTGKSAQSIKQAGKALENGEWRRQDAQHLELACRTSANYQKSNMDKGGVNSLIYNMNEAESNQAEQVALKLHEQKLRKQYSLNSAEHCGQYLTKPQVPMKWHAVTTDIDRKVFHTDEECLEILKHISETGGVIETHSASENAYHCSYSAGKDFSAKESKHIARNMKDGKIGVEFHEEQLTEDELHAKQLFEATDCNLTGAKQLMGSREKKMTQMAFHRQKCHAGYMPGCKVCMMCKRNQRRRYAFTEPHSDNRPGYSWSLDGLTFPVLSKQGNRYTLVLRDFCTGYYVLRHIWKKSESCDAIKSMVKEMRLDPRFAGLKMQNGEEYKMFSELHLDPAGEWRDDGAEWNEMTKEMGINCIWGDPTDKRSMAFAENAVKQIELGTKYIMAENSLPVEWWETAADQAAMVRNLLPMVKNVVSGDGDAIRPAEQLSGGKVSRNKCNHILHHLTTVGTPCLVTMPNTKGSDVVNLARNRWGILHHMVEDLPVFECPITKSHFRSKAYVTVDMPESYSAYEFLGLKIPQLSKTVFQRMGKHLDGNHTVVEIEGLGKLLSNEKLLPLTMPEAHAKSHGGAGNSKIITVDSATGDIMATDKEGFVRPTGQKYQVSESTGTAAAPVVDCDREITFLKYFPDYFLGRDVWKEFGKHGVAHGNVIKTELVNNDTGKAEMHWQILYDDGVSEDYSHQQMISHAIMLTDGTTVTYVPDSVKEDEPMEPEQVQTGEVEDLFEQSEFVLTNNNETFFQLCKRLNIVQAQWKAYYELCGKYYKRGHLHKGKAYTSGAVPFNYPWGSGNRSKFDRGVKFPIPGGKNWKDIQDKHRRLSNAQNKDYVDVQSAESEYIEVANRMMHETKVQRWHDGETAALRYLERASRMDAATPLSGDMEKYVDKDTGKIKEPKTMKEALLRPDAEMWDSAISKEMESIRDLGVLSYGHTLASLKRDGYTKSPVPAGLLFNVKYHPDGLLDKYKSRFVQKGHPGNMVHGVHYHEVFAAAPKLVSTRILQGLRVTKGWHSLPFDICVAFLHADTRKGEQYPIRMPVGLRTYDENGVEEYCLLEKNLYGSPVAPRRFGKMRDDFILSHFNENGWTAQRMRADPCMFKITSPEGFDTFMVIHTDDVDQVSEKAADAAYIAAAFDEKFSHLDAHGKKHPGVKMCDPSYMLGVTRTVKTDDEGKRYVEIKQKGFIENMYAKWKHQIVEKNPAKEPFPPKSFLSFHDKEGERVDTSDEECKTVLQLGYQKVVGELLWAARNCYPECSAGVVQLCSVMSRPTHEAWHAAMYMVSYLNTQADRGIRFAEDGNLSPITYYDASNKGDHTTEKAQYGWSVHLFGGPISWSSRKHKHVGKSSSANEYMALSHAAVETKWVRDLLREMGFGEWVSEPTPVMGDNDQATKWSIEDMVTTGNKCIRVEYHYVKECVEEGDICPRRIDTTENVSDIFTKPLAWQIMNKLRDNMTGYGELPELPPPRHR